MTANKGRYELLLSTDDVAAKLFKKRQDLLYPLRKETRRDRFIMNSQGLKNEINNICLEAIDNASKELAALVANDIKEEVYNQINDTIAAAAPNAIRKNNSFYLSFAKALGSGLGRSVNNLFSSLMKDYDNYCDRNRI